MTGFQTDNAGMPPVSKRGSPDREWGMQDPKLRKSLYIDAQGILAVKAAAPVEATVSVSAAETPTAHRYLSADHAAVLVTALAVASEHSLSYDGLPLPDSIEDQPEKSL